MMETLNRTDSNKMLAISDKIMYMYQHAYKKTTYDMNA